MKILITGSQGMLGRALKGACAHRGYNAKGLDLHGADYCVDLMDDSLVADVLKKMQPDVVVNCAAVIDIALCDSNPLLAWKLNARSVGVLAEQCRINNARLVQISTDHYFSGNGATLHNEDSPVSFLNEYARTKYAGEAFALSWERSLVLRTNILGFRGHGKPTFAEWAFDAVEHDREMTLFNDSYVSCIDVASFSESILDLVQKDANGLLNVANREVFSKKDLIEKIADISAVTLTKAKTGSVEQLNVRRANSCGLNVKRAEIILERELPNLIDVVTKLNEMRRECYEGQ